MTLYKKSSNPVSLHKTDNKITDLVQELKSIVPSLSFENFSSFQLTANVLEKISFNKINKVQGIYLFEMNTTNHEQNNLSSWIDFFQSQWTAPEYLKKATPSIKKKRLQAHNELLEWMPIYIGKSKYLSVRIKSHFTLMLNQKTTGLKLIARVNLHNQTFRIRYLPLYVKNYDVIAPLYESIFREQFNPIVGRQ